MNAVNPSVRMTVTCDSCGTKNQLIMSDVNDQQDVSCSSCGEALGTVEELVAKASDPGSAANTRLGTPDWEPLPR